MKPITSAALTRVACVVMATAGLAGPVQAQGRPPLMPTRDVTITYRLVGKDAGGQSMQMSHGANGMMRIESPSMQGYGIVDRKSQRFTMVMTGQRSYMDLKTQFPGKDMLPDEDARFTRKGTETIAGYTCTVWTYESKDHSGTACITADGVTLRAVDRRGAGMEAVKVAYGSLPPVTFAVPSDYQKMEIPAFGGTSGLPPGVATGGAPGFAPGLPPAARPPGR